MGRCSKRVLFEHDKTLARSSPGLQQGHEELQAGESVRPGITERCWAVFGQVLLSQQAEEAQSPGFLQRLGQDPHVGRTAHVIVAADQRSVPLHQPLQVCVLPGGKRRLRGRGSQERCYIGYIHKSTVNKPIFYKKCNHLM